jgi:hypothetical protein
METNNQQSNCQCNKSILEIIYDDADKSCDTLSEDINSINTRLTFLIGFNATLASLLLKLPIQNSFLIKNQSLQQSINSYPNGETFLNVSVFLINLVLSIKPLVFLLIGSSIIFAIIGIIPNRINRVIFPEKMLQKSKNCTEEEFRTAIIKKRHQTIENLEKLSNQKASRLKQALIALGSAALLTVIDIVCNVTWD